VLPHLRISATRRISTEQPPEPRGVRPRIVLPTARSVITGALAQPAGSRQNFTVPALPRTPRGVGGLRCDEADLVGVRVKATSTTVRVHHGAVMVSWGERRSKRGLCGRWQPVAVRSSGRWPREGRS